MNTVKIAGRTFDLAFTLDALAALEDLDPNFDLSKVAEMAHKPRGLGDLVFAMAQQGELLAGRPFDVSRAWIGAHLSPSPRKLSEVQVAVLNALADGLRMETESDEEEGEKDVVLEEIKKKGTTDASPTAS